MDFASDPAFARLHAVLTRINMDPDLDSVLQAISDGVVEVSGFQLATINVLHPEDETFELVAYTGVDASVIEDNLHHRYPADVLLQRTSLGEKWGAFRFVSHELDLDAPDGYMVVEQEVASGPDAWHPLDELSTQLRSARGDVLGIMYVDQPRDGRKPSPQVLALMEIFAVAAGVTLEHAQRRAAEHEEVWLAGLTNAVLDAISGTDDLDDRLDRGISLLRTELGVSAAWLDTFPPAVVAGVAPRQGDGVFTLAAALDSYGELLAQQALEAGEALVLDLARLERDHPLLTEQQRGWLARALESDSVTSVAVAPLDNESALAGQLVLTRRTDRVWTARETRTLREIGRELGWALGREESRITARAAEEEVARAARERREMLTSLVREIAPKFTTLDTYAQSLGRDDPVRQAIDACWTTYGRVGALVSFERPEHTPRPVPVDMDAVLSAQLGHLTQLGREREVSVLPVDGSPERIAWADPDEIEWVVQLLTEDVVQRADPGSSVRFVLVTLNHRVVLSCLVSGAEDSSGDDDEDDESERDLDPGVDTDTATAPRAAALPPASELGDPWWLTSVQGVLQRGDGRLSSREGPSGRRVVSLSLPVPPQL